MKPAARQNFWYLPYLVQAVGLLVLMAGLTRFLDDDAASYAFRSLPSLRHACPVLVIHHAPPSGSRFFIKDEELRRLIEKIGDTPWLINVSKRRVEGKPPAGAYRQEGAAPLFRSEELVRHMPEELLDHARALKETLRAQGKIEEPPWWSFWPIVSSDRLVDASMLRWVDTMSLERSQRETLATIGKSHDIVLIGSVDTQGGPLTHCGQVSETTFLAIYFAALLAQRQIYEPSPALLLFSLILLSLFVAYLNGRFGRRVASLLPLFLLFSIGAFSRTILTHFPLWILPVPFQVMSVLVLLAPLQFGSPLTAKERHRLALETVRRIWKEEKREGLNEAITRLSELNENEAKVWEAIVRQDELKDEDCISPATLPLHEYEVEELYELGFVLEKGYHWNESLLVYDWAALKKVDYLDLSKRRQEAKDAVLGNLEFIDIDEITESVDKRYEKLEMLGQGGMGVVLRGWDSYLERPIALKLIMPNCLTDEVARERFLREIETLSSLNHDQIVSVFNVHKDETLLYYTMELLDGASLQETIGVDVDCSWAQRFDTLAQMAEVLHFIHQKGIHHRDLKPDNVLIVEGRGPVLIDFGIAKAQEHAEGLTQAGQLIGTLAYMAPELVRGGGGGKEADIFAFGVILYEVLTGKLPFTNPVTLKAKAPPLPREHNPDLPQEAEELILQCMSLEPSNRPADFGEVAQRLRKLFEN